MFKIVLISYQPVFLKPSSRTIMASVLITGINGFVGSHLADHVLENNLGEVSGLTRGRTVNLENIQGILERVKLISCDIADAYSVQKTIEETCPDFIFHLAAQAFVPESWRSPIETMNTNVNGSLNLFEAIRKSKCNPLIQIAGSSEEYGLVLPEETPIKETNELRPLSPYGVSKVAMDLLGFQYFKSYGMKIVRTRGFNQSGPRRGAVYVDSDWCKQVAEIEKRKRKPEVLVGNLQAFRDFTDVRDMVKAYWLALEKCKPGEVYNICSEKAWKMQDVLDKIISLSNIKNIKVREDAERLRPSDVPRLVGDCSKFRKQTGWKTQIPYEKTLEDLLNYWRQKV